MACFLVPTAEAVVTTIAAKVIKSKEKTPQAVEIQLGGADDAAKKDTVSSHAAHIVSVAKKDTAAKIPFSRKLGWLNGMLWGGSALLAFEHVWHGEVVPWFPFLTAAGNAADTAEMLHEMATAGVAMSVLVTAVWLGIVGVTALIGKKVREPQPAED